jgi:protein-disulfide isomerase
VVKAARVQPKSRTPFYILLLVAAVVGATGIWYSMQKAAPAPITLAPGTKLPDAEGYLIGRADAPVTIIEFGDFECPGCGQFANLQEPDVIKRLVEPGLASFRFYDFPLTEIHGNTMVAHLAASCANDQGKFWPMHDLLFKGQYDWNTQATREPRRVIDKYAEQLGLTMATYDECMSTRKNLPKVEANKQAGVARGVGSTPTLVIGDRVYAGGLTYDQIRKIVDSTIAAMPATTLKPAPAGDTSAKSTVPPKP